MNPPSPSDDLTPIVGSQTDVAPLGRSGPPPAHEQPAGDPTVDWAGIAASEEFKALVREKVRFIVPTTIFFIVYYFALPVLVGWYPELMKTPVWGKANLAYVFALSQFFMAWAIAAIYVAVAAGWDRKAAALIERMHLSRFAKR